MIGADLKLWTLVWMGASSLTLGEEQAVAVRTESGCEDLNAARVIIDAKLGTKFFLAAVSSYPWHVIDHGGGRLEDTMDGTVDPEDRVKTEHTANCVSDHQGTHTMEFCDASFEGALTILKIWGGEPAYASSLTLRIAEDLNVKCSFEASYPAPVAGLAWRITKKSIRLRENHATAGERLYGWLSVEFEERSEGEGKVVWKPYKIEGYFKPVIRTAAPN